MFSDDTINFLIENRINNSREWFLANKKEYRKYVVEPMAELVEELRPCINRIDPEIDVQSRVGKSISRINRDLRYSKDKSLYRDVIWCSFYRPRSGMYLPPGLFFELSPDGFRYGCGYYSAPSSSMKAIREMILTDNKAFKAARAAFDRQNIFSLEGEEYKRERYSDEPEYKREWLNKKNMVFIKNSTDFALLYSDKLGKVLTDGFYLLEDIYSFLVKAEELAACFI